MAEEEIIPEVEQQPPQLQPQEEKKKRGRPPKQQQQQQPQKKQQQQQQQIKEDKKEKKGTTLSDEDKALFRTFKDKYKFEWDNENAGFAVTRVGDDIIFVRKIGTNKKGFAQYKNDPYLILKTNIEKFKKFKDKETGIKADGDKEKEGMADDDEKEEKKDDIIFEYFNFSNDYFKDNEKKFADSLKKKKFLFDNLGKEKKEEEKKVNYFGWNEFKRLGIIPSINDEKKYKNRLENFDVEKIQDNIFIKREAEKEKEKKDLFGIDDVGIDDAAKQRQGFYEDDDEEPKEEPLPKEVEIEDDIDNPDFEGMIDPDEEAKPQGFDDENVQEINVQQEMKKQHKQKRQRKQRQLVAQNNQLINAGHTPNGEELRALIKYNNNSDSLLKLIVSLSNDNKGEVDFKEIGEIQDLNGDITNLYSDMQDLKSKINSSNNEEEKERLLIKYNKKRLKLEDLVKKYSKEAYRLSTLNKKKKATFSNPNYIKNKLNKL